MNCPKCESRDWKQERYSTGAGWGLLVVGFLLTITLAGAVIGIPMIIFSLFLTARRNRCRKCKTVWGC